MSQRALFKQMARSSSVYALALAAGKMASFFMLPVYTRFLTPADYGVIELLELTSFIFSTLVGMRIGDALFYYYAGAKDQSERERIITTVFVGSGLLGAAGGALGWLAAPLLSAAVFGTRAYTECFHIVFATFAFAIPAETGFCYLRALDRPAAYVGASVARLALAIALNVVLLVKGLGLYAVLWSSLGSTAAPALCLGAMALSKVSRLRFSGPLLGRFLRYSMPLGLSGFSMFLIHYGDRFFLQRYATLSELGIYSLAYKLGMLISYLQTPFDVYWRSQMFTLVRGAEGEKVFVRVATYLALGLAFAVLLLALFAEPLLRLLTPAPFWSAAQYVPWIATAYLIRTVGAHFRCVFLLEGRTAKELKVTATGTAVCVAGYALLIPVWKLWGAVASTLAAFAAMFVVGLWESQRVRRFSYEFGRIAAGAAAAAGLGLVFAVARPQQAWAQFSVAVVLASLYPVLLVVLGLARREEVQAVGELAGALVKRTPLRRLI